jgi:hypothetical protein
LKENRKRRRSSASSAEKPFQQLLKGFENVVHEKALLTAEVAAPRAENQHQKQKRARQKGYIRQEGSITIQDGQESVRRRLVEERLTDNTENIDPVKGLEAIVSTHDKNLSATTQNKHRSNRYIKISRLQLDPARRHYKPASYSPSKTPPSLLHLLQDLHFGLVTRNNPAF